MKALDQFKWLLLNTAAHRAFDYPFLDIEESVRSALVEAIRKKRALKADGKHLPHQ